MQKSVLKWEAKVADCAHHARCHLWLLLQIASWASQPPGPEEVEEGLGVEEVEYWRPHALLVLV